MKIEEHDLVVLTEKEDEAIVRLYDLATDITKGASDPDIIVPWSGLLDALAKIPVFTVDRTERQEHTIEPNRGKWSEGLANAICDLPDELFEELLHSIDELTMQAYSRGFCDGMQDN